jgi:hypothetical protein
MVGVIDGGGGRREMQEGIDRTIDVERLADIVLERLEVRVASKVGDIASRAGDEIVDAKDLPAVGEQPLTEVGAEKARASGDDRPPSYERPTPR